MIFKIEDETEKEAQREWQICLNSLVDTELEYSDADPR